MFLRIGFFCLCVCFAVPAHAEDYIPVAWPDLLHTMIRFNALDVLDDNNLLDEYAAITECDLYQYYYKDDFKWNQVRQTIRKSIELNKSNYPARYYFDAKFKLDRYDFDTKLYRFAEKSSINNINAITIFTFSGPICDYLQSKYLPLSYRVVLNPVVSVPGLALEPRAAEALMKYMDASDNEQHYTYARFNMTVIYIEPLRKNVSIPGAYNSDVEYYQSHDGNQKFQIDVRVDSVDFYKDAEYTALAYTFKPPP